MSKKKKSMLDGVNLRKLQRYLKESGGDGWTIWPPEKFTAMGFAASDLPISKHRSDTSDPKSTIYKHGKVVPETKGVYNLTLLRWLAQDVGARQSEKIGRGSEARELTFGPHGILAKVRLMVAAAKAKSHLLSKDGKTLYAIGL
jgi:hypothetical protein